MDTLAALADFGPETNILSGDPQLRSLVDLLNVHGFFDLAEHLVDQQFFFLVVGGGTLLLGLLYELVRIPFRVRGPRVRRLVVRLVRLRFLLLALLGAAQAGLRPVVCGGLEVGDHLLHHPPLLLAGLQVGRECLRTGLGGRVDHLGPHRAPSGVHELERRAEVLQRERPELRGADRDAVVRGVAGEGVLDLPLEADRHGTSVVEPGRDLGCLLPRTLLLSLVGHI